MIQEPRPLKKFGQNFLKNPILAQKIAEALDTNADDTFIEIGPGPGTLTRFLIEKPGHFIAIEYDERWIETLCKSYPSQVDVRHMDILKFRFDELSAHSGRRLKIIGNIPYNITSPILFKLLDNCKYIDTAVLMMQKEVAARLTASVNQKAYGILTVAIGAYAKVEKIMSVGRRSFLPVPKVDSTVLRLNFEPDNVAIEDGQIFREVVRGVFNQRRKMLTNSLKRVIDAEQIQMISSISLKARPEQLTITDFIRLTNEIVKIRKRL